jgi:transcription elongation GreA/GreB family factor
MTQSAIDSAVIDKQAALSMLRALVADDLARASDAQRETQRGATHEEAKPENDKDTRALEATYLARGLAERVVSLENATAALAGIKLRAFDAETPLALGAVVTLTGEHGPAAHYFLVPAAGGLKLTVGKVLLTTVTLEAPLGRALLGAYQGDEVSVQTPQGVRALEIERVL